MFDCHISQSKVNLNHDMLIDKSNYVFEYYGFCEVIFNVFGD